jgi:DNA-binding MarR family transcriptional regulator
MSERFFRSVRLLAECYQAFERISGAHVRSLNLTASQFDIIATLGNTEGMSFKELGEKTLITKGTLTGIIDRLTSKGLVSRCAHTDDRRSSIVRLTPEGQREFERIFPLHVAHCKPAFAEYSDEEFLTLERELTTLKKRLLRGNKSD